MAGFRIHDAYREYVTRAFRDTGIFSQVIRGVEPAGDDGRYHYWSASDRGDDTQPAHAVRAYVPTQGMLDELTACRWGHPDPDLMDHVMCRRRGLIDDEARLTARGREVLDQTTGRRRAHG